MACPGWGLRYVGHACILAPAAGCEPLPLAAADSSPICCRLQKAGPATGKPHNTLPAFAPAPASLYTACRTPLDPACGPGHAQYHQAVSYHQAAASWLEVHKMQALQHGCLQLLLHLPLPLAGPVHGRHAKLPRPGHVQCT